MDKKLITVIVPIYKVEDYLDRCIESVVNQTYNNLEIILVDDGSPDNCPKMCDAWAKKDKRIKVIHKANGGLSDARNAGINVASGDFLFFVDSDDLLDNKCLEILMDNIIQTESDLSICECYRFTDKTKICNNIKNNYEVLNQENICEMLLKQNSINLVMAQTKLYKKDLFKDLMFEVGKIHEDEFIAHKIYIRCNKVVITSAQLYLYYLRNGSITQSGRFTEKNLNALQAIEDRYSCFKNTKFEQLALRQLINMTIYLYSKACAMKAEKALIKFLKQKFKFYYKQSKNKRPKQILFNMFPWVFSLQAKLKVLVKKVLRK